MNERVEWNEFTISNVMQAYEAIKDELTKIAESYQQLSTTVTAGSWHSPSAEAKFDEIKTFMQEEVYPTIAYLRRQISGLETIDPIAAKMSNA